MKMVEMVNDSLTKDVIKNLADGGDKLDTTDKLLCTIACELHTLNIMVAFMCDEKMTEDIK